MNLPPPRALRLAEGAPRDPEGFLAWAANTSALEGFHVELARGEVTMMMVRVSQAHALVCSNLSFAIRSKLGEGPWLVTTADFGVRTPVGIRYPDILVARPGEPRDLATTAPLMVAEVLSPSSVAIDMVEKRDEYLRIPTLQAYLVCSQDEPRAWLFRRDDGVFHPHPTMIEGREATVEVPALALSLPMADIFAGIPDAPTLP
ncbi:Uma2 family endonuclease [Phreatobacter sp.]|uniref:Uma2 family endonuclease n=1 Tax=Phreatobacter sp. TaxID=1966341 RepID=UPI003F71292D